VTDTETIGGTPIPTGATECPDCHASLEPWKWGAELRCSFRRGPGYGACGEPREPLTLVEAAREVLKHTYGDRDQRHLIVALREPTGRPIRAWHDFRDAVTRADTPKEAGRGQG
jgi:hypothetical protein